ncbi:MAG: restriction endonuclease subunit M, partial [Spirochaetia bacterium]|nr:restriction endonuclease subunit M [Spirochaetia bacterium]
MPNAKDVKKRFLEVKSFADVRDFFVYLDGEFRPHATEDEQGLEIDLTDADYMEVYVYTDRAEIEKRARRGTALRFCQLAISSDFEDWTFTRHGVEGKVKLLKYRIQKKTVREAESPVSMQRLAKLGAGKLSAFEDLFERKDISGKFYAEYAKKRVQLIKQISGIDDEADSRWFAQVLLDRIIFLYFLQKKGILAGDERYLIHKLQEHVKAAGKKGPSYYKGFLTRLFFETLCTKPADRSAELTALTGTNLPYLNGGLFLKHDLEETYPNIDVDNRALSEVFLFLETWMWNVSERSETDEDAIDPYILGYIFEKSLGENKSQGVYYTPPFLSEFLARETIEAHLLRHANQATASAPYPSLPDFLAKAHENDLVLLYEHLRSMTVCDPACGSGQFLVQALHEIGRIHESLLSRARTENMDQLLRHIQKDYAIDGEYVYGMRRFIVARNLYGVDLLSESVEITKLRLFIGMVEGLEKDIREPLPNIDFNIRAGNSLMGFREMPSVVRDSKEGTGAQ